MEQRLNLTPMNTNLMSANTKIIITVVIYSIEFGHVALILFASFCLTVLIT